MFESIDQFEQLVIGRFKAVIVSNDSHVVGHDFAHFFVKLVLVFAALVPDDLIVYLLLPF